jgi:hypothetical protein
MSTTQNGEGLRKKDRKWLQSIEIMSGAGGRMYSGERVDFVPTGVADRLHKRGFIEMTIPHNPAHKERWVITESGRSEVRQHKGEE